MEVSSIVKKAVLFYLIKSKPPKIWRKIKNKIQQLPKDKTTIFALTQLKYKKLLQNEIITIQTTVVDDKETYLQQYRFKLAKLIITVNDIYAAVKSNNYKDAYKLLQRIQCCDNLELPENIMLSDIASLLPYTLLKENDFIAQYVINKLKDIVNVKVRLQ